MYAFTATAIPCTFHMMRTHMYTHSYILREADSVPPLGISNKNQTKPTTQNKTKQNKSKTKLPCLSSHQTAHSAPSSCAKRPFSLANSLVASWQSQNMHRAAYTHSYVDADMTAVSGIQAGDSLRNNRSISVHDGIHNSDRTHYCIQHYTKLQNSKLTTFHDG